MINGQAMNRVVRQSIDGEIEAADAVEALNTEYAKVE
jgi:multiple sugar transport system substrate-binding protein